MTLEAAFPFRYVEPVFRPPGEAESLILRGGEPAHSTPIEYRLPCLPISRCGKVMTERTLLREIWGPGSAERSHYLRVYVGHLRQKIEYDAAQPKHLLTETGVGYRFQP